MFCSPAFFYVGTNLAYRSAENIQQNRECLLRIKIITDLQTVN